MAFDHLNQQVKPSFIYYALGKTAKELEGYKTARICYQKLTVIIQSSPGPEI